MKFIKLTFLFLVISIASYSQTIINAERLGGDASDSTIYALTFTYTGTRGNMNTDRVGAAPSVILLRNKNHFKFFGGYSFFQSKGSTIIHNGFVHARHNYIISERLRTFEYYQIQFNEILLLTNRQVFGAGLRYDVVHRNKISFDIGGSLMREYERLNEDKILPEDKVETRYTRLGILTSLNWSLTQNVKLYNVLYYQPYLMNFYDYRLLSDLSIVFNITEHFDFLTTLTTRYDSQPPGTLVKLDNLFVVGLTMKF